MIVVTVLVAVSITDTVSSVLVGDVGACLRSGVIATASGLVPTVTVVITVFGHGVDHRHGVPLLSVGDVGAAGRPGRSATPTGCMPTGIGLPTTMLVAVSITDTLSENWRVT